MKFTFTSNKIRFENNNSSNESFYHFFDQELFSNSLLQALRYCRDEEKAKKAYSTCKQICGLYLSGEIITNQTFQERVNKVISEL